MWISHSLYYPSSNRLNKIIYTYRVLISTNQHGLHKNIFFLSASKKLYFFRSVLFKAKLTRQKFFFPPLSKQSIFFSFCSRYANIDYIQYFFSVCTWHSISTSFYSLHSKKNINKHPKRRFRRYRRASKCVLSQKKI